LRSKKESKKNKEKKQSKRHRVSKTSNNSSQLRLVPLMSKCLHILEQLQHLKAEGVDLLLLLNKFPELTRISKQQLKQKPLLS
jgi:hypothetical protein